MEYETEYRIRKYAELRDEALISLDKEKLIKVFQTYGVPIPTDEMVFWAGIHKARLHIKNIPEELKEESKKWLLKNGMGVSF